MAESLAKLGIDKSKLAQFTPTIPTVVEQVAGKDKANQLVNGLR